MTRRLVVAGYCLTMVIIMTMVAFALAWHSGSKELIALLKMLQFEGLIACLWLLAYIIHKLDQ